MQQTPTGPTRAVTPYLIVADAAEALSWYADVFGMQEVVRLADKGGKVMHAEVRFGEASIMIADEFPDMGYRSPTALGGSLVSILLYVDDVDATFRRAVEAGADELMPATDQFDGDRRGNVARSVRPRVVARHQTGNNLARRDAKALRANDCARRLTGKNQRVRISGLLRALSMKPQVP